jgi:hypothetical protein
MTGAALTGAHFLAGSLLSLIIPVALVAAVIVYWAVLLRRNPKQ